MAQHDTHNDTLLCSHEAATASIPDTAARFGALTSPLSSAVNMNERHSTRTDLLQGIVRSLGRRLSVYTALYHGALAEQLGLNVTDLNALDLILELESVTAGQLAELMGVSSGGITTVIDRLERAGFVEREKNPNDRRMVMIHPVSERCDEIEHFLTSVSREITAISAAYDQNELSAIHDFLVQSVRTLKSETLRLRFDGDHDIAQIISSVTKKPARSTRR